jgi:hypothetical protein
MKVPNGLLSGFFLLMVQASAFGQTAAIDQVKAQLMTPPGCTVQKSGLWATTTVKENPSEIRVDNGKISRGSAAVIHGRTNVPIQPGQVLPVVAVVSSSDAKNDLLTVSLKAAGLAVPIVFVFPQGALQKLGVPEVLAQVATVLQPPPVQPPAPKAVAIVAPAPPPPSPTLPFVKWSEPLAGLHTSDVKAACESKDSGAQAICFAVFSTLQDAEDTAHDAQSSLFGGCFPEGTTAQTVRDAFLTETQALPDQLEGPVSIFYGRTLADRFPCPKAPPSKRAPIKKKPS